MSEPKKLYILWTNADILTADKMIMMYATNSMINNWWEEITVIIWGATAKLVAENALIQEKLKIARHAGVQFSACKACTDQLGVTGELLSLGIEVIYWGPGLTEIIKSGEKLITI